MLNAVDEVNQAQKSVLFQKVTRQFGDDLTGRTIAVWGLAFKPRTDDIREAPALVLIDQLLAAGAKVQVHDPVAMDNVKKQYSDKLIYCDNQYDALANADALTINTEWNEFRNPDFDRIKKSLKQPVIFDGRNLFDPAKLQARGFQYEGIGLRQR